MSLFRVGQRIKSYTTGVAYTIGEYLGEGAFGMVYRARARNKTGHRMPREVCIKVTPHEASWHREAYFGELLAGNHRVIQVLDSFPYPLRIGRRPKMVYCLVLELAQHGALSDWLESSRRPWSEGKVKREVVALLRVLDQLHGGAALHRDLTPFNVFVCANQMLKIGDFGIAGHMVGKKGLPAGTFNIGWAPIGIVEENQRLWLATDDIYQMGQLLAVLVRGDAGSPISTRQVRDLCCSDEMKAVIRRAIGQRQERYRDALEMIAAIEHPTAVPTGGVPSLTGKVVVFTGPLSMARQKAKKLVLLAGGRIAEKVTNGTDVLVRGARSPIWIAGSQGAKLLAAARIRERGGKMRIINERQFLRLVRHRLTR